MKHDRDEWENLLRRALAPSEKPSETINRRILQQASEEKRMRQHKTYRKLIPAAAAALMLAAGFTAYAAWNYRNAGEIAGRIGDEKLSGAFAKEDAARNADGVSAAESQTYGGYTATFLGLLSGNALSDYAFTAGGKLHSDRTYCAVAIQRADGSALSQGEEDFFVSPLIGGLNPALYNAASLFGSYAEFAEDGILYRLLECDNISYFADHALYLCVSDTAFYDGSLYRWDETSGTVTRNTDYQGLNALFTLHIDPALADPVKAQELIDAADAAAKETSETPALPSSVEEAMAWAAALTPETIADSCVRMENTVQTCSVDADGWFALQPWLVNEAVSDTRGGGGVKAQLSTCFDGPGTIIEGYNCSEGMEDLVITTLTLSDDNTVTFAAWVPKDVSIYLR